jgi:MFS transporter, DHA1 family, inner membrane transport protein
MTIHRLLAYAAGNVVVGTGAYVVAGLLPLIVGDFGVDQGTAGLLVALYALTYGLGSPVLMALTAAWSRRAILCCALALYCVGCLGAFLAPAFWPLVCCRVAMALGGALYAPAASASAAASAAPERRGFALSIVFAGFTVANVVGVPLGTLAGNAFGWRGTFVILAGLAAVTALAMLLLRDPPGTSASAGLDDILRLLQRPVVITALAVTALQFGAQFCVYTFIAALLRTGDRFTSNDVTWLLFLFGGAGFLGNLFGGRAADRWGADRIVLGSLLGLAPALAAMPLIDMSSAETIAAVVVWGFAGLAFASPQQSRLLRLAPDAAGIVLALNASAIYLGSAGGAFLGGAASHAFGLHANGTVAAATAVTALTLFLVSARPRGLAQRSTFD